MDSIIRYAAGKLCEFLIPVKHSYYEGKGTKAAICTLGSLDLLEAISYSQDLMANISIVGRLLSENNGIDADDQVRNRTSSLKLDHTMWERHKRT